MIRMCIKDRVSSYSSYNLLFSEKIQLHFVLVLWRVIGHPYIESATALSDKQPGLNPEQLKVVSVIFKGDVFAVLPTSWLWKIIQHACSLFFERAHRDHK